MFGVVTIFCELITKLYNYLTTSANQKWFLIKTVPINILSSIYWFIYLFCYYMVSLISLRYYFLIVRFSSGLYRYQDPHLGLIDKVKAYWETLFNPLTPRSN